VNKAADRAAVSLIPAKLSGGASVACGPAELTAVADIRTSATIGEANSARRLAQFMAGLLSFCSSMIFDEDRHPMLEIML
jgi:hypothetical protein